MPYQRFIWVSHQYSAFHYRQVGQFWPGGAIMATTKKLYLFLALTWLVIKTKDIYDHIM